MASEKGKSENNLTLAEIRSALDDVERQRAREGITVEERLALEDASMTLRAAERAAVTDLQNDVIKAFKADTENVSLQAKHIRETVSRMGRLPKALDTVESVIKECSRVLKLIANFTLVLVCMLVLVSCATLGKSQMSRIKALALASDSVSSAPSLIFSELADVRLERGLFYVASLDGVDNHLTELNSLTDGSMTDQKISGKVDVYVDVLNSYLRSLRSIASETRWQGNGTELRGIGRNVDSLLYEYNRMDWGSPVKTGFARQLGRTTGYISEEIGRRVQYKAVRSVIGTGDSIVSQCCDSLVRILDKDEVEQLIVNEEKGLESNYRSYLSAMTRRGVYPSDASDRNYVALRKKCADIRAVRKSCISALKSLEKAHHKLLEEMDSRKSYSEYMADLQSLSEQSRALWIAIEELMGNQ